MGQQLRLIETFGLSGGDNVAKAKDKFSNQFKSGFKKMDTIWFCGLFIYLQSVYY
jgi:hypothetical protein